MNAIERCEAKLAELRYVKNAIANRSESFAKSIENEISAINSDIEHSTKSAASVLKTYRKKLEKARKIFLADEVDA